MCSRSWNCAVALMPRLQHAITISILQRQASYARFVTNVCCLFFSEVMRTRDASNDAKRLCICFGLSRSLLHTSTFEMPSSPVVQEHRSFFTSICLKWRQLNLLQTLAVCCLSWSNTCC